MWRHIAQSLQGPSHIGDGTACQDHHSVRLLGDGADDTLVACIADGAGSAEFAHLGSEIACRSVIDSAAEYFTTNRRFDELQVEDAVRWCEHARARIQAEADLHETDTRAFATTLGVVIASPNFAAFFQIGDGAIVLGDRGLYGVVFWPQIGEYANSTNFLTAEDYRDRLEFLATSGGWSDIALMTDGLQRLALQFDSQTPHAPFFDPLFRALRAADDLNVLNEGLRQFLASDSVQQRSDDDKTLILACR